MTNELNSDEKMLNSLVGSESQRTNWNIIASQYFQTQRVKNKTKVTFLQKWYYNYRKNNARGTSDKFYLTIRSITFWARTHRGRGTPT